MVDPGDGPDRDPGRLTIDLLGPLRVQVDGRPLTITAARQRSVLAALAVSVGRPVSADDLLSAVWGDDLPQTGSRAVAYQISRLRSLFEPDRVGEGTVIATSAAGYTLDIEPDRVDVYRFDRLIDGARARLRADGSRCERLLDEALALWRGRPFADLGDEPFVEAETRRLEHRRLLARRTLAEARLAEGRYVDAIADLETLVEEQPLEEGLVLLLMTALHRAGRTADALRAYGALRRRLGDELGIEPSSDLRRLETRLVTGDGPDPVDAGEDHDAGGHDESANRPSPIPASLSSFIGRTSEISEIVSLLASARLVTLSGFGGLGKTRLAQQIAGIEAARHADGVWFVDLTPIADATLLADTLIAAGGGGVSTDQEPVDLLLKLLEPLDLLLVIDNCEHLVDDVAALVTKIIAAAPSVQVLTTSRRSLGVVGEAVRPLSPLDPGAARQLFVERARLARASFAVDDPNRSAVDRLCDRLEGIPLAIEMAAARLSVLTVDQIIDHLDDRFQLLTRGERDADPKQRSLAAVLDWSCDLLDSVDRRLLTRLSICIDGFDLDAASAVQPPGLAPGEVVDRLAHLVEVSLVTFSDGDGTPRYRLLETVREHAAAMLDPDEHREVALAHAQHFEAVAVDLAERWHVDMLGLLATGDRELGNIRSAISWCYANGHPHLGLSIIYHARTYLWAKMMNRETLRWLLEGIDLVVDDGPEVLRAAAVAVVEAFNVGDRESGQPAVDRIVAAVDQVEDDDLEALLLNALGTNLIETAPRSADDYYRRAGALPSLRPDRLLSILNNRVEVSWMSGSLVDAEAIVEGLREVNRALSGAGSMATKIEAGVAARAGCWDDVIRLAEEATDLDPANEAAVRITYAEALGAVGRLDEGLAVLDELDLVAHGHYVRNADLVHAAISLRRGDPSAALTRLADLVEMVGRAERPLAIAVPVAALLATAACGLERFEAAAVIFGFVDSERRRLDINLRPTDRRLLAGAVARCRSVLGARRFAELSDRGAGLDWSELPAVEQRP